MDLDKDMEHVIKRTKHLSKWGCFFWVALLLFGPVIFFVRMFIYEINFKETILITSHSPSNHNTIKVVEKGQAAWFGPSKVRIKFGWKHLDRIIYNDGKRLDSNVVVRWENDDEALIIIDAEEQSQEIIKFNANETPPFKTKDFEVELGSFTFKTSESPNLINIIEFREISKSTGSTTISTVKIYFGKRGSILENYKEYIPIDMYTPDNFRVEWKNDEIVQIEVIRKNENGENYVEDMMEINFSEGFS